MKLYGGIDLHSTNSVVAVIDEQDKVVYRKQLPNDLATIRGSLEPYRERLEASFNPLIDAFELARNRRRGRWSIQAD